LRKLQEQTIKIKKYRKQFYVENNGGNLDSIKYNIRVHIFVSKFKILKVDSD